MNELKHSPVLGVKTPEAGNYPKKRTGAFCNAFTRFCNGIALRNQIGGIANTKFGVRAKPFNGSATRTYAANEYEDGEYSAPELDAICAENENSDGWYLIAPFGDFPHKVGTQHFDTAAANEIITAYNSCWQRLKRACGYGTTIPVYRGHPDVAPDGRPGISTKHFDQSVYGKVEDLAAGNDGLRAKISWSPDFSRLPHGLRFSPFWFMKTISKGVHRPTFLKSIGLTATPNIPLTSAANELENQTKENEMLKAILMALGFSETEVVNTVENKEGALAEAASNSDTAKKAAEAQAATAQSAQGEAENELRRKEQELTKQTAAAANERAAFADYVVNAAIKAGKLTEADRTAQTDALKKASDIVAAANELDCKAPVVATKSETDDLKKGDAKAAAKKAFNELVSKYEAAGDDRATATVRAKRELPEQYKLAFES